MTVRRLSDFRQSEDGAVAILFSASLFVILGAVGAAIDYSRMSGMRAQLQAATDSAILAAIPSYAGSGAISAATQNAVRQALDGSMPGQHPDLTLKRAINGQLCLDTAMTAKMLLPFMMSRGQISATACAANNSTFEIALALDNTGSMAESAGGQSKMQALVAAATKLVNVVNSNPAKPNAAISVVPFASAVNVGSDFYYNGNAQWLDRFGQSSIHWQNYTRPSGAPWTPGSRFDLLSAMGASWGGCIEERPAPYLTTDDAPSQGKPDTLFVPYVAPDDPGAPTGGACYSFTPSGQYPAAPGCGAQYYSFNSYLNDDGGTCAAGDVYAVADAADPVSHGSGASKVCKYKNQPVANVLSAISGVNGGTGRFPAGPNLGCSIAPLTTLTSDMSSIAGSSGALSKMAPNGDTALLPGFMWAWRTISPNGPFANSGNGGSSVGPKQPRPYGQANNTKIIVLMTDGFNHWAANPYSPYKSMYSALGFYVNGRVANYGGSSSGATAESNYRAQMDAALVEACNNAKAVGVQIYTVGFSVPSNPIDAAGVNLLQACASSASNSFIAQDSGAIVSTFQQIASNILSRRLTR
ncbi:MAG: TadE/TadG family type IV pilus assembly protein [Rhodoblastus sp.]